MPPAVQIAILAASCAAAVSLVWSTLRLGISPMPSSARARRAVLGLVDGAPGARVLDLGSGWGSLAIACARRDPSREVIGYELSWVPWMVSLVVARLLRVPNVRFVRADFLAEPLPADAVVLCYLFREGMRRLGGRIAAGELRPALVISIAFALPGEAPCRTLRLDDAWRTPIYVYAPQRA